MHWAAPMLLFTTQGPNDKAKHPDDWECGKSELRSLQSWDAVNSSFQARVASLQQTTKRLAPSLERNNTQEAHLPDDMDTDAVEAPTFPKLRPMLCYSNKIQVIERIQAEAASDRA